MYLKIFKQKERNLNILTYTNPKIYSKPLFKEGKESVKFYLLRCPCFGFVQILHIQLHIQALQFLVSYHHISVNLIFIFFIQCGYCENNKKACIIEKSNTKLSKQKKHSFLFLYAIVLTHIHHSIISFLKFLHQTFQEKVESAIYFSPIIEIQISLMKSEKKLTCVT